MFLKKVDIENYTNLIEKKNQAAVLKKVSAIWSFTNPQRVPVKSRLYSLVSGSLVNKDVANDILNSSVWFGVDIFFCF